VRNREHFKVVLGGNYQCKSFALTSTGSFLGSKLEQYCWGCRYSCQAVDWERIKTSAMMKANCSPFTKTDFEVILTYDIHVSLQ
jgi:hypothetical protein